MNGKEKIIQAALELFAEKGYTETSIDKIAKRAKVAKSLTYTHFKNKEALLEATIERTITAMTAAMMDIDQMDIPTFLEQFFVGLERDQALIRLCVLLVVHPQTPVKVNQLLEAQKQELLTLLEHLLQAQFGGQAAMEAAVLLAIIDGITLDFVSDPNPATLQKMKQYLIQKYSV